MAARHDRGSVKNGGKRGLRRFWRGEDGSATVESVLWLPMFFAVFILMADVAMIFNGQTRITRIVQDANRNFSVNRLKNEAETEAYVSTRLAEFTSTATVDTVVTAGVATTIVQVPARELEMIGLFSAFNSLTLTIGSTQFIEY